MGAEGDDYTTANHPEGRIVLNAANADTATEASHANAANSATEANHANTANAATEANHASAADSAIEASKLTASNVGSADTPVYFKDGVPVACENIEAGDYLPLSAGADYKLTGPLGLTEGVMYGTEVPEEMFEGQLFFVEEGEEEGSGSSLPVGGSAGQVLVKNSDTDGDAFWSSEFTNNSFYFYDIAADASIVSSFMVSGEKIEWLDGNETMGYSLARDGLQGFNDSSETKFYLKPEELYFNDDSSGTITTITATKIWTDGSITGNKVYGAVWNDYAEYRGQKELIKPGYCVASMDNGQVYKTTEKFQACDGIVSDTFGFAIGETDECKTPLAVAGRVLAYCEGNRYDYHAGDTVCAGPDGKIVKMSREEIREWPDRIIGIVSEIPEYETWGAGNVLVDGRIWIKVK